MAVFEKMEHMAERLNGTGGGSQANAVIAAINLIRTAPGRLDKVNAESAILQLAEALVGKDHCADLIVRTAQLFEN